MSEISKLAAAFEQKSTERAENTEKAVKSAFEKHENALLSELSASEKRTRDAIRAQNQRLQRTALKSWMFIAIPLVMIGLLAAGSSALMGKYITHQVEQIASYNRTLATLEAEGSKIKLTHCGESRRLCAKIDADSGRYGNGDDDKYLILDGY